MKTTVQTHYFEEWIKEHNPNGAERLAIKAGVSTGIIYGCRRGKAPKKLSTKLKIVRALDKEVTQVFREAATSRDGGDGPTAA